MKQVLIDASSAILLHKTGFFGTMATAYALGMVPSVLMEVTRPGRPGSAEFGRYRRLHQLAIVHFDRDDNDDNIDQALSAMGRGERDTILAARTAKSSFIVLDDRKGARYCRLHEIPYTNALLCVRALYLGGFIAPDAYTQGFSQLLAIGRYTPAIVDFAMTATRASVDRFLP